MSQARVRGTCWCEICKQTQVSFLSQIIQNEGRKEVVGTCSVCTSPVHKVLFQSNHEANDETSFVQKNQGYPPPPSDVRTVTSNRMPLLLILVCLLFVILAY